MLGCFIRITWTVWTPTECNKTASCRQEDESSVLERVHAETRDRFLPRWSRTGDRKDCDTTEDKADEACDTNAPAKSDFLEQILQHDGIHDTSYGKQTIIISRCVSKRHPKHAENSPKLDPAAAIPSAVPRYCMKCVDILARHG